MKRAGVVTTSNHETGKPPVHAFARPAPRSAGFFLGLLPHSRHPMPAPVRRHSAGRGSVSPHPNRNWEATWLTNRAKKRSRRRARLSGYSATERKCARLLSPRMKRNTHLFRNHAITRPRARCSTRWQGRLGLDRAPAGDALGLQAGDCGRGMGVGQGDSCVDNEIPRLLSEALSRCPTCR